MERMRTVQSQKQNNEVKESRYSRRFEEIRVSWVPAYLRRKWSDNEATIIAKFKCGKRKEEINFGNRWRRAYDRRLWRRRRG